MTRTLDEVREILTVKNAVKLLPEGQLDAGTEVRVLRKSNGSYVPCVGYIRRVTATGRITVDMWDDRSQTISVNKKTLLWPAKSTGATS